MPLDYCHWKLIFPPSCRRLSHSLLVWVIFLHIQLPHGLARFLQYIFAYPEIFASCLCFIMSLFSDCFTASLFYDFSINLLQDCTVHWTTINGNRFIQDRKEVVSSPIHLKMLLHISAFRRYGQTRWNQRNYLSNPFSSLQMISNSCLAGI